MVQIKLPNRAVVYAIKSKELAQSLIKPNVCDFCDKSLMQGYLIPVLNSVYCSECYERWSRKNSPMSFDDLEYQAYKMKQWEGQVPITNSFAEE